MKPEQSFHNWVKDHIPGHHQRIESIAGSSGIPDLSVCYKGSETWLELKVPVEGKVILRKEQYAWGLRRAVNGGSVWVVANFGAWIYLWKFEIKIWRVAPYGKDGKYVQIMELPTHKVPKDAVDELIRILFEL